MYHHVLVKTKGKQDNYYELDQEKLEELMENIVLPYLKGMRFQIDGFFVDAQSVERLMVTQSVRPSGHYFEIEKARRNRVGAFLPVRRGYLVTQKEEYCNDITREVMKQAEIEAGQFSNRPSRDVAEQETSSQGVVFLAYSYREHDEDLVEGFRGLLEDKGYRVLDGKADRLGSLSKAILDKISSADIVIIVMTKRDEKMNGMFTISPWLLEEKGAAKAFGKHVAMFVEEGVDPNDIGGLQGDDQRFDFTRNNFTSRILSFTKILENA